MNRLHPTIEDSRINIARHEFAHALLAHELGFFVESITLDADIDRHTGATSIVYPMGTDTFEEAYARSPLQAAAWAVQILGVIRAGSYCEIHRGMIGGEPKGEDLAHIERWRGAVLGCYGPDGWTRLYAEAYLGLKAWYNHPEVREAFREAAPVVAYQEHIGRYQLLSIFAASGALSCPPPRFTPVLPPTRRQTAPPRTPAFSASVRRRVELQVGNRESAPAHFGRNPDGSPRHFTHEEMAYIKGIQQVVQRRRADATRQTS